MSFWKKLVIVPALTLAVGVSPLFGMDQLPQPDQEQIGESPLVRK